LLIIKPYAIIKLLHSNLGGYRDGKLFGTDGHKRSLLIKIQHHELAFKVGRAGGPMYYLKVRKGQILVGKELENQGDMLDSSPKQLVYAL